ncbi:MAG: hypothetical protein HY810_06830 [Candidatus Omnitrophica bacterium]|nr:hypothetical protein [Candidatus Omnitrophota bacterium]
MGTRLTNCEKRACSTIQYGVELVSKISKGDIGRFKGFLEKLEFFVMNLPVDPQETLIEGEEIILKFSCTPESFHEALVVSAMIPSWFKATRKKWLRDEKLREMVNILIPHSFSLQQLRTILQFEIRNVGAKFVEEFSGFYEKKIEIDSIDNVPECPEGASRKEAMLQGEGRELVESYSEQEGWHGPFHYYGDYVRYETVNAAKFDKFALPLIAPVKIFVLSATIVISQSI